MFGEQFFQNVKVTVSNRNEALVVVEIVQAFVDTGDVTPSEIGVITPYEAQTALIKSASGFYLQGTWQSMRGVHILNIDGSQGREFEVVVVSMVRCNHSGTLGHVDDCRRLNVALTRAKRGLVVVGHARTLQHGFVSGLKSFIQSAEERGVVIPAWGGGWDWWWLSRDGIRRTHAQMTNDTPQKPSVQRSDEPLRTARTWVAWIPEGHAATMNRADTLTRMSGITSIT